MSGLHLDPYQVVGAQFLVDNKKTILGDDMGLGKTVQALAALRLIKARTSLVVCPKNVRPGWAREAAKWLDTTPVNIITPKRPRPKPGHLNIVHYDIVHRAEILSAIKQGGPYEAIICDEAHKLKNTEAKRTVAVLDKRSGITRQSANLWLLTGTPVLNRPIELYPLICACNTAALGEYANRFRYALHFCAAYKGEWGWDFSGASHLPELANILRKVLLRRTAEDVGLPIDKPNQQMILVEPSEVVSFEELERERNAYRDPHNQALGDLATLRSKLALSKVAEVSGFAKDVLDCKDKVVIFGHHIAVLNALAQDLKDFDPVIVNGQTKDKQAAIDKFIKDKTCRVFLANYDAAAEGIDGLQQVCHTMITAELIWTPELLRQAIARLVRRGQTKRVNVYHVVMENSADADFLESLTEKEKNINILLTEQRDDIKMLEQSKQTRETTVNQLKRENQKDLPMFDNEAFKKVINDAVLSGFVRIAEELQKINATQKEILTALETGEKKPAKKSTPKTEQEPIAQTPATPAATSADAARTAPTAPAATVTPAQPAPIQPSAQATPAATEEKPLDGAAFSAEFNVRLSEAKKLDPVKASNTAIECRKTIKTKTGADMLANIKDLKLQKQMAKEVAEIFMAAFPNTTPFTTV